jgi:hypothetical protein
MLSQEEHAPAVRDCENGRRARKVRYDARVLSHREVRELNIFLTIDVDNGDKVEQWIVQYGFFWIPGAHASIEAGNLFVSG